MIKSSTLGGSTALQNITPQIHEILEDVSAQDLMSDKMENILRQLKDIPEFSKAALLPNFAERIEQNLMASIDPSNEVLTLKAGMLMRALQQTDSAQQKSDEGEQENAEAKPTDQNQSESNSEPEDDGDDGEEAVPGVSLIDPLFEHSKLDSIMDYVVNARAVAPLYAVYCLAKVWGIKTLIFIKEVLSMIRLLLGIEALVMLIGRMMDKHPNHPLTWTSSTALELIKKLLILVITIFMVITKPHKYLTKLLGEDFEEMLGNVQS